ncbi:uncharacterized protein [Diabrotica undecimpunctata]|uniref:uncharacterized protein n=1 Tax=Diabrotica undecimpunctata TaxID=50387 RepID=UPI003B63C96C
MEQGFGILKVLQRLGAKDKWPKNYVKDTNCGLGENERKAFYDQLEVEDILNDIPSEEKVIIGGDFNAHVGQSKTGYAVILGGLSFRIRNEAEDDILELSTALDMSIVNTFFQKGETQLITHKGDKINPK